MATIHPHPKADRALPADVGKPQAENPPAAIQRATRPRTLADILTQVLLPVLGLGMLAFAIWYVVNTKPVLKHPPPPIEPARSPYADTLAASGVVEAQTQNIAVGSATPGVVVDVLVTVGDEVEAGTPLFRLDDRQLQGTLAVKQADLSVAKSELVRLEAEPRQEKIPVIVAQVDEANAAVIRETDALRRAEDMFAKRVLPEEELINRREALAAAKAKLDRSQADLSLLKAGSWEYDLDVARAMVVRAEADMANMQVELDRLEVRALVSGRVLQVNVRPGEFVGASPGQPLVILGNTDLLHVRADIDEFDIARFNTRSGARAVPRGNLQEKYPLEFVRVEPFVVPKRSLTGDNTERVDTRVLQVIYRLDSTGHPPLYVGQQVEVFVDAEQPPQAVPRADASTDASTDADVGVGK